MQLELLEKDVGNTTGLWSLISAGYFGICHCEIREQAETLLVELEQRLKDCKLEIHPDKTKIAYCKDGVRKATHCSNTKFVFLGYEFRARGAENKSTKQVCPFNGSAMSREIHVAFCEGLTGKFRWSTLQLEFT